jgi:hypothetical protein
MLGGETRESDICCIEKQEVHTARVRVLEEESEGEAEPSGAVLRGLRRLVEFRVC